MQHACSADSLQRVCYCQAAPAISLFSRMPGEGLMTLEPYGVLICGANTVASGWTSCRGANASKAI